MIHKVIENLLEAIYELNDNDMVKTKEALKDMLDDARFQQLINEFELSHKNEEEVDNEFSKLTEKELLTEIILELRRMNEQIEELSSIVEDLGWLIVIFFWRQVNSIIRKWKGEIYKWK